MSALGNLYMLRSPTQFCPILPFLVFAPTLIPTHRTECPPAQRTYAIQAGMHMNAHAPCMYTEKPARALV